MTLCTHREKKARKGIIIIDSRGKAEENCEKRRILQRRLSPFSLYIRTFEDLSILKFNRDDERESEGE